MMTKQKGFVAALLMTTFYTPLRADAACTPTPDCAELGYTQTLDECPDNAVKCPWDTSKVFCYGGCDKEYKYTCTGENETAGLCKCGGKYIACGCLDNSVWENGKCNCDEAYKYSCTGTNEVAGAERCGGKYKACRCASGYKWENGSCVQGGTPCAFADIYYTDNTCLPAEKHDSTKEVLGIVVYINPDGVGGQIMTPWPIDANGKKLADDTGMYWSTEYVDIADLPNYTTAEAAIKDYNSCSNTDIIVKQGNASTYPAAWATRRYAPNEATKGKWCLPAAGIMTNIYRYDTGIKEAIRKVGGVTLASSTWSSSEFNSENAWTLNFYQTDGLWLGLKNYNPQYHGRVRPVLEF